ncbi:putative membrane protein [Pseudomonas duriflava]|uniref:Putative membrane protein n=1 Tax=Pseudomonas duriflava TaxID=459528 RepID=A0A562QAE7_9PSED|nr:hypothetical protein [Pseudomonas duriflava]TWI53722.1 putative membrane protein [Pseudomonas duriflava]
MRYQKIAVTLVVLWFLIGGAAHLFAAGYFVKLVPIEIPYRFALVCFGGIFEMIGAIGLLFKELRRSVGILLFAASLIMMPMHFYVWQHAGLFPALTETILLLRLFVHAGMLWLIWYSCICYTCLSARSLALQRNGAEKELAKAKLH